MHSKNTLRLHKLLQNLLSEWHSLPSKHGNHGKCLAEIIAIVRERAKESEAMDRTAVAESLEN
jgi:hypothetical protein